MERIYDLIEWHNNTNPALNEDNLNAMSQAIYKIDGRVVDLAGTLMEDVPRIKEDMEILEPAIRQIETNVERSETAADNAEVSALKSEGYAIGEQDGVEVGPNSEYYQKNAKYYAEIANPPIENTVDFTDIITISDAINKAAKDVRLKVEAVQDLHGYTKPWVGGAGDNLLDVGESISDWFATSNNGTTIVDGDISTKVTATITSLTGNIKVTNYNSTGYWWMSKVVKLKKNTDYKCYYGNAGGSAPILFGFSNLNAGTVGTQISPFYNTQSFNSGNYEYVVISIYPNNVNFSEMQIKEASASATFTPYKNICPISGWDNAKVESVSAAVPLEQGGLSDTNGSENTLTTRIRTDYVELHGESTIQGVNFARGYESDVVFRGVYFYTENKTFISFTVNGLTIPNNTLINVPSNAKYYRIVLQKSDNTQDISSNGKILAINSITTTTISLNGTRYGGTLDVTSGVLTVIKKLATYTWNDGTEPTSLGSNTRKVFGPITDAKGLTNTDLCNVASYRADWVSDSPRFYIDGSTKYLVVVLPNDTATSTEIQVCYELATPQTIQLTPTQVYLLYGYNTLFGDCGDISLTYDASGIIHIEEAKLDTETLKTIAAASSDFADFKARIAAL